MREFWDTSLLSGCSQSNGMENDQAASSNELDGNDLIYTV
jgi:hypothetical protein